MSSADALPSAHGVFDAPDPKPTLTAPDTLQNPEASTPATDDIADEYSHNNEAADTHEQPCTPNASIATKHLVTWGPQRTLKIVYQEKVNAEMDQEDLKRYRFELNFFSITGILLFLANAISLFGCLFFNHVDRGRIIDAYLDSILSQPKEDTRLDDGLLASMITFMSTTMLLPGICLSAYIAISAIRERWSFKNREMGRELEFDFASDRRRFYVLIAYLVWISGCAPLSSLAMLVDHSIHRVALIGFIHWMKRPWRDCCICICIYRLYHWAQTVKHITVPTS